MRSDEVRKKFLEYFENNGHRIVQSDLLVPRNDPTLLFTGAGMNQFKEQFMGKNISYSRVVSSQKCLRTGDIENVGKTPRHHTFFEMLGNFSFGDYFKTEAITWGWNFLTKELAIPEDRLWVSVYEEDVESYNIWINEIGRPKEKIVKLGAKDNFWPSDAPSKGPNGPCGPCSEIFYDWGEAVGCSDPGCNPACECGRFVEVWNLVFTEFERKPDKELIPLPNKNIDTGMGLERIVSVIQNVHTNFETDLFIPIIAELQKIIGKAFDAIEKSDIYLIVDHIRAVTFSIGDGVSPSNESRGYVIRKLIRRAYLRNPEKKPFLYKLVPKVTSILKEVYPDTAEKSEHISAIVEEEENKFNNTLNATMPILEGMLVGNPKNLSGENIFKLVDTYGLPVDVIEETADERKIELDKLGFEKLMNERKEQSRRSSDITNDFIFQPDLFDGALKPEFSDSLPLETSIEFILKKDQSSEEVLEGEDAEIILSPQSSCFYAELGGQTGDTGSISKGKSLMKVLNTYEIDGRKVLYVRGVKGEFKKKDIVVLSLDDEKKKDTAKNHTATHLLQAALREVLGDHVKQSGSAVDENRLRFDFTHMKKLSEMEIFKIEDLVNLWIGEDVVVCKEEKTLKEAKDEGALSFFGEKYGDTVRVVTVGGRSKELCGGTHVDRTSDINIFKITSETSIASGIRRIEAVTGENAQKWVRTKIEEYLKEINSLTENIDKVLNDDIISLAVDVLAGKVAIDKNLIKKYNQEMKPKFLGAVENLKIEAKKKDRSRSQDKFNNITIILEEKLKDLEKINGVNFFSAILEDVDMGLLRNVARFVEKKIPSGVVLLAGSEGEKASLICIVTGENLEGRLSAKDIVSKAAGKIGGKGGGKDNFAQAGGSDIAGLTEAVNSAREIIEGKE